MRCPRRTSGAPSMLLYFGTVRVRVQHIVIKLPRPRSVPKVHYNILLAS